MNATAEDFERGNRPPPTRYFRITYHRDEVVDNADGDLRTVPMPAGEGTIDVGEENERRARRFMTQFEGVVVDSCVEINYLGEDELEAPKKKKG